MRTRRRDGDRFEGHHAHLVGEHLDAVQQALAERLAKTRVGDPRAEDTRMGPLVSLGQRDDVRARIAELQAAGARIVAGDPNADPPIPGGAFLPPVLLRTDDPWRTDAVHDCEPFGPVSTIMPYRNMADAIALANRGKGSLALSLFTHSPAAEAKSAKALPEKASEKGERKVLMGYYPNWSHYNGFTAEKIPFEYLTHLLYAFYIPDNAGNLSNSDESDAENFKEVVRIGHEKGVKIMVSIGGLSQTLPWGSVRPISVEVS